tara:strand:- start:298 stop:987 length:690 start_codon:yes stop_codon:yes gene_type:complete
MSKKASKRYKKLLDSFKDNKVLSLEESIKKVKQSCTAKFDESIDVSLNLNLKQKKEDLTLRTVVNLPHGNGKKIKVGILCEEGKINEAKSSGADVYGSENLVEEIMSGKINFDKLIATPAMMSKMGKLGKILGPKGLMPNPKLGTVTNDVIKAVKLLKEGQIEIKNDVDGNIAASIGKKSFDDKKILDNFNTLIQTIKKEKPNGIKGDFIVSSYITSSMGISHKLKVKA